MKVALCNVDRHTHKQADAPCRELAGAAMSASQRAEGVGLGLQCKFRHTFLAWKMSAVACISRENWCKMVSVFPRI